MSAQEDILHGVDVELRESSQAEKFGIEATQKDGSAWKVWLTPGPHRGRLDESLEGAYAWWPGNQRSCAKGTADVLSVVPEEELVVLCFVTSPSIRVSRESRESVHRSNRCNHREFRPSVQVRTNRTVSVLEELSRLHHRQNSRYSAPEQRSVRGEGDRTGPFWRQIGGCELRNRRSDCAFD